MSKLKAQWAAVLAPPASGRGEVCSAERNSWCHSPCQEPQIPGGPHKQPTPSWLRGERVQAGPDHRQLSLLPHFCAFVWTGPGIDAFYSSFWKPYSLPATVPALGTLLPHPSHLSFTALTLRTTIHLPPSAQGQVPDNLGQSFCPKPSEIS